MREISDSIRLDNVIWLVEARQLNSLLWKPIRSPAKPPFTKGVAKSMVRKLYEDYPYLREYRRKLESAERQDIIRIAPYQRIHMPYDVIDSSEELGWYIVPRRVRRGDIKDGLPETNGPGDASSGEAHSFHKDNL